MLEREKTFKTKSGREFTFRYPTFIEETEIQTEVLRRMAGIVNLTPDNNRVFVMHYFNVAFELLTVKAPDKYFEEVEGLDGKKTRRIDISRFYADDKEFMEARKHLSDFLASFRPANAGDEVLSSGNGADEMESAENVPASASISEPARDLGRGAQGD
jgi:hypothetical protein